jgi:hypothetical protein
MKLFTCDKCKGEFEAVWSDEEAMEEFERNFPDYPFMEASQICDDCYKLIMGRSQQ